MTFHRIRATTPALALLFLATACGGDDRNESTTGASPPDDAEVIARVDGEPVTVTDLDAQLQAMAQRGEHADEESALEEVIDLRLLVQKAEAEEMHRQPEIAAEIRRQRGMLLANHLVRAQIDALEIDEARLREAYDAYIEDGDARREYKARHILVDERAEAEHVIEAIQEGGDFAELAREHSTGPSSERGGDLDWFRADDVVTPFAEAVARLETEEYTGEPVASDFGWHVILLEDRREIEPESFDDMRDELRGRIIDDHITELLRDLREGSEIEIR